MPWLRLDDGFAEHDKILGLTHQAFRMHVTGMLACARNLTDGYVSEQRFATICAISNTHRKHVAELEAFRLWRKTDGGWQINDYLEYNPSADKVKAERQQAAERQAKLRARRNFGQKADDGIDYSQILKRDKGICHICGKPVKDGDVHFDHVIPISRGGDHTLDNIKVAHARCNLQKSNRVTPNVTRDTPGDATRDKNVCHASPSRPLPSRTTNTETEPVRTTTDPATNGAGQAIEINRILKDVG